MMEDQSRPVPSSFLALHADARGRLTSALAHVRARYELCEDLASQLYVTAQALHHDDGLAPSDVLAAAPTQAWRRQSLNGWCAVWPNCWAGQTLARLEPVRCSPCVPALARC